MNKREKWINIATLALGIALLPPLWAIMAPYIGISIAAVSLICAGVYAANGNKISDGIRVSIGFLCGDLWAVMAIKLLDMGNLNADLKLFLILFILGFLAVVIASIFPKYIFLPSMLCGWAIGIALMGPVGSANLGSLPLQIGIAMLVGVWYVGAGVDKFQRTIAGQLLDN